MFGRAKRQRWGEEERERGEEGNGSLNLVYHFPNTSNCNSFILGRLDLVLCILPIVRRAKSTGRIFYDSSLGLTANSNG